MAILKLANSFLKKILFIILFVFLVLAIAEGALRLGGWAYLVYQDQQNRGKIKRSGDFRILCIGESTTAVGGNDSYPNQLERALRSTHHGKNFVVINKGIPGVSSGMIVDTLESWIKQYDPDIVIAMLGVNDLMAFEPVERPGLSSAWKREWQKLRLVKLAGWIRDAYQNRTRLKEDEATLAPRISAELENNKNEELKEPEHERNSPQFKDKLEDASVVYRSLYGASWALEQKQDWPSAESLVRKLISLNYDPQVNVELYRRLAYILERQEKFEAFAGMLRDIPYYSWGIDWIAPVCQNPRGVNIVEGEITFLIDKEPKNTKLYDYLSACYAQAGEHEKANRVREESRRIKEDFVNPVTKKSYTKLLNILYDHKGIVAVLMQYPLRHIDNIKAMISDVEKKPPVYFVDNRKNFEDVLREAAYEDIFYDRFAGDFGHCTARGNKILAENAASVISEKLLR